MYSGEFKYASVTSAIKWVNNADTIESFQNEVVAVKRNAAIFASRLDDISILKTIAISKARDKERLEANRHAYAGKAIKPCLFWFVLKERIWCGGENFLLIFNYVKKPV